jgi:hypothetical protein
MEGINGIRKILSPSSFHPCKLSFFHRAFCGSVLIAGKFSAVEHPFQRVPVLHLFQNVPEILKMRYFETNLPKPLLETPFQ